MMDRQPSEGFSETYSGHAARNFQGIGVEFSVRRPPGARPLGYEIEEEPAATAEPSSADERTAYQERPVAQAAGTLTMRHTAGTEEPEAAQSVRAPLDEKETYRKDPNDDPQVKDVVAVQAAPGRSDRDIPTAPDSPLISREAQVVTDEGGQHGYPSYPERVRVIATKPPGSLLVAETSRWSTAHPVPAGVITPDGEQQVRVAMAYAPGERVSVEPPDTLRVVALSDDPKLAAASLEVALRGYAQRTVECLTTPDLGEREGQVRFTPEARRIGFGDGAVSAAWLRDRLIGDPRIGITQLVLYDAATNLDTPGQLESPQVAAAHRALAAVGCVATSVRESVIEGDGLRGITIDFMRQVDRTPDDPEPSGTSVTQVTGELALRSSSEAEPPQQQAGGGDGGEPPEDPPRRGGEFDESPEEDGESTETGDQQEIPIGGEVIRRTWGSGGPIEVFREVFRWLEQNGQNPRLPIWRALRRGTLYDMMPLLLGENPPTAAQLAEITGTTTTNVNQILDRAIRNLMNAVPVDRRDELPRQDVRVGPPDGQASIGAQAYRLRDPMITQTQAAAALGISRETVSLFVTGQRFPTEEKARAIMQALGVPAAEIDRLMEQYPEERKAAHRRNPAQQGGGANRARHVDSTTYPDVDPKVFGRELARLLDRLEQVSRQTRFEVRRGVASAAGIQPNSLLGILEGHHAPSYAALEAFLNATNATPEEKEAIMGMYIGARRVLAAKLREARRARREARSEPDESGETTE